MKTSFAGIMLLIFLCISSSSCATTGRERDIDKVLILCHKLLGPDANKGDGEVWFWLQDERAKASKRLWNVTGLRAVDKRLSVTTDEVDRNCLARLKKEVEARKLVYE
jgi:hypothetical protein